MDTVTQPLVKFPDGTRRRFSPVQFRELFEQSGMAPKEFRREFFGDSESWASGLNNKRLTRWLNGLMAPKLDTARQFAQVLGCNVTDLYEEAAK
jgi:transcriptional regulator with XRE-family HTH domain